MNTLIIIWIIGLIILIHEAGHFIAARAVGIPVSRFSLGFGPRLWSFKNKETEFLVSSIPLGGYVMPAVDNMEDYQSIPAWKRIVLSLGGPLANLAAPLLILSPLFALLHGPSLQSIFLEPVVYTINQLTMIITAIPSLFTGPGQLSGVVGIVAMGSRATAADPVKIILFSSLLSLNLAVFNLLPFPVLDGGKILMYMLEKIHPRLKLVQIPLSIAGWVIMMGLMIYVTYVDVARILS